MWVEIIYANHLLPTVVVTPLAGVWVEMDEHFFGEHRKSSLPLRECGLKSALE